MSDSLTPCPLCGLPDVRHCRMHPNGCEYRQEVGRRRAEVEARRVEAGAEGDSGRAPPSPSPLGSRLAAAATPRRGRSAAGPVGPGSATDPAVWGPKLWADLHLWAAAYRGPAAAGKAWLAAFGRSIPGGSCPCRSSWRAAVKADPPPLEEPGAVFGWSVRIHDRINVKLGRPEMGEAEARLVWEAQSP